MKEIPLTQGKIAIVDDEDYGWLSQYKWNVFRSILKSGECYYARRAVRHNGERDIILMHRMILGLGKRYDGFIDHVNHNGLDNRLCNLRICTNQQNNFNMRPQNGRSSKFKGVSWFKRDSNWRAQIKIDYKGKHLGYFSNEVEAALAYNKKAKELFGEFACLNEV